ncbi:MAG TPA: type II toxin-antitoxin system VapC family toxin, partial [Spirochaetia bacterium]|nr:type II toxin-antitoxin system VapC family toxin [Spirochaetia bacterium]
PPPSAPGFFPTPFFSIPERLLLLLAPLKAILESETGVNIMENKATLYLETTIPSYLAAKPSRDLITAAHQQETHDWWDKERDLFNIYISQAVLDEVRSGDPNAALLRSKFLEGIDILPAAKMVDEFAEEYASLLGLPDKAATDGLHLAYAVFYKLDYLMTWNCKHLAHGEVRRRVKRHNSFHGLYTPEIVTPLELRGGI